MEKLYSAGAVHIKNQNLLRYSNGELISARHIGDEWFTEQIGHSSYVEILFLKHTRLYLLNVTPSFIHRADYHRVLLNEALRLGVTLQLGSNVQTVDFESPSATLDTGSSISADVVIVADGLQSLQLIQMVIIFSETFLFQVHGRLYAINFSDTIIN